MSPTLKKILVFGSIIAGILLILLMIFAPGKPRYSWREHYKKDSKDPYGTYLISQLLQEYFPDSMFVLKDSLRGNLLLQEETDANYVFIGEAMFMTETDRDELLAFVENGNRAFISSRVIPYDLMFYLYYEECDSILWNGYSEMEDSLAVLGFKHQDLTAGKDDFPFTYQSGKGVTNYRWQYIAAEYFCDVEDGLVALGQINDSLVNFAQVTYGAGSFYLHTNPMVFSNLQLLDENGISYADRVFSHLQPGTIYWDEYSRITERAGRKANNNLASSRRISENSPLQYILSQPPLAWAWYLLLSMGLLFLLFRARRKQRIIPVLEKNTNTSLEFLATIGRLYFLQNNHKQLALQKTRLLLNFIRERYHLHGREPDEDFLHKLAVRSEISQDRLSKIFLMHQNISNSSFVSDRTLIEFHKNLTYFYQNCK